MSRDTATSAAKNRRIRQEALREQLAEQCRLQHIIDGINKLEDEAVELDAVMANRIKSGIDSRMKLMNKYLPDLKSVDIEGDIEHSGKLEITWQK